MKASDFRIGNLVKKSLKSGNGRKVICEIGYADIQRIHEDTGSFNYDPIQITEKWLLKFRFEKIDHRIDGIIYKKSWLRFNEYFKVKDWMGGYIDSNNCKYVHQLQNLYFALTGEELTIKTALQ